MSVQGSELPAVSARVKNIGGIQETTIEFPSGVTILVGRNATNRTSFLRAVMAALGSDDVSINANATEASVELEIGDSTYHRRLQNTSNGIITEGTPYLEDTTDANLFAFLLESNEARRAVATGNDLRDIIMRPVDTAEINAKIERLTEKRKRLQAELDEISDLKAELPDLEAERDRLQDEIETTRATLEATEEELAAADADVQQSREDQSELEDKFSDLREKRASLDDIRYDLETERESLSALERERNDLENDLADIPDEPQSNDDGLDAQISKHRSEEQRLKTEINELQSIIGFNEEMLHGTDAGIFDTLRGDQSRSVTDELLPQDTVECWTCGSEVDTEQIQNTVSRLQELSQDKVTRVNELQSTITELETEREEREQAARERERIERRLDEIDSEVDRIDDRIDELQTQRESVTAEIEEIEAEVEALEDDSYDEILSMHREANELEYELGQLETNLEQTVEEIRATENRIADEADLRAELESVKEDIVAERNRIERIEQEAVDQFNNHMDTILELLEYANLERIWLERVNSDTTQQSGPNSGKAFELHVVRSTDSGTVYQDTVDHLSESEREVTGLVFGLAGYLAHEVYETVPFMLLDSLEAIDSDRIAALIEYLEQYTDYLLVALLPEDASSVSSESYSQRRFGVTDSD